jgi:hypothetical protein
MNEELASYQFLPYVRLGIAASITTVDTLGLGGPGGLAAAAAFDVSVPVNDQSATVHLDVHGPGDVIGINPRQVVRTDPHPNTTNFEPNYFPIVEFDRPDFPWLFTPAAATGGGADGKLRPWVALVIVREQDGVRITQTPRTPLPVLEIGAPASPAAELPDLAESWLWAHGQVLGGKGADVAALVTGDPHINVSRLIGSRRLDPDTHYVACVVPTFEVGRLAGLGQPIPPAESAQLATAWTSGAGAPTSVRLPVYVSFTFATGAAGDFEYLARLLVARPVPPTIGSRPMDVSHPGAGLPDVDPASPNAVLRLEGALRAPEFVTSPWTEPDRAAFQAALANEIDAPARLAAAEAAANEAASPTVAPPIYGQWHAGVAVVPTGAPPWLSELNLDARNRVVAGLGTRVVQADQEDLMASAWKQIGDVNAANAALRQAQLARAAASALHARSLSSMAADDILQVTSGAHSRLANGAGPGAVTVSASIVSSILPLATARTPMRRALRTFGPLARRTYGSASLAAETTLVDRMSRGALVAASPSPDPDGTLALAEPVAVLGEQLSAQVFSQINAASMVPQAPSDLSGLVAALNASGQVSIATPITSTMLREAPAAAAFALAPAATSIAMLRAIGTVTPITGSTVFVTAKANPFTTRVRIQVPPDLHIKLQTGGVAGGGGELHALPATVQPPFSGAEQPSPVVLTQPLSGGVVTAPGDMVTLHPATTLPFAEGPQSAGAASILTTHLGPISVPVVSAEGGGAIPAPIVGDVAVAADSAEAVAFRAAAVMSADQLVRASDVAADPALPALDLSATKTTLLAALDPEKTVPARALARIHIPFVRLPHVDPIEPVMAGPTFPRPMWQALRDLSQDWLLPGLEEVPPNTVTLVETNPTFVTSFLVGLNHEMGRELLWREYPSDSRGTYFKRFWGEPDADDIGAITSWSGPGDLGSRVLGGDTPRLVLLVRGELLRRYPGAVVYAVHATGTLDNPDLDDTTWLPPLFRGLLLPDVTFIGFDLTVAEARGDTGGAGWWFVIAQQPTEPRFGLDIAAFPPPSLAGWNDLNWGHLAADATALQAISYVPAAPVGDLVGAAPEGLRWGTGAGVQAHIHFQQPVRVAMHASDLLPPAPR